jgi:hypothetical protein
MPIATQHLGLQWATLRAFPFERAALGSGSLARPFPDWQPSVFFADADKAVRAASVVGG